MHKVKCLFGSTQWVLMAIWCLIIVCGLMSTAFAGGPVPATGAEEWVLNRVMAGEPANLKEKFTNEADRHLRASFLLDLLTNEQYRDVHIAHAVLTEAMNFHEAAIPHKTELINCQFEGDVDLSRSTFHKNLSFAGSTFKQNVLLHEATFKEEVKFTRVEIAGRLWASKAWFIKIADLHRLKVGDIALFDQARFFSAANFHGAEFQQMEADGVKFLHPHDPADFSNMTVRGRANLTQAEFRGKVYFRNAGFSHLFFQEAHFQSEYAAFFDNVKVSGDALFHKTVFAGPVFFNSVNIVGNFDISDSQFGNSSPSFNDMKVQGSANFSNVLFKQYVTFDRVETREFKAENARFLGSEHNNSRWAASFFRMQADQAIFTGTVFVGNVDMSRAVFQEFSLHGPASNESASPFGLSLAQTAIRRQFDIKNLTLQYLDAASLQVEGPTTFERICLQGKTNLKHSRFGVLYLSDIYLPKNSSTPFLHLDGMAYQYISSPTADNQPLQGSNDLCAKNWQKLSDLLIKAEYSPSAYANLENFYRRHGDLDEADNVFVAQKRREREKLWQEGKIPNLVWNYLLDGLVRYGRSPGRALVLCFAIVVLGWFIFRSKEQMMLQDSSQPDSAFIYSSFWYSLDLFLPFIDLHAAEIWIPRPELRWRWLYMRTHAMLGWILVPIGLAALTGVIK